MHPRRKAYLIFSIVYWLLVAAALALFGSAFDKVHVNHFALRRNYYNSQIDEEHYISGLYHKELGFYFLEFPASKTYLTDLKLNVTNADMKTVEITYTLVYRLRPQYIYSLYQ